MTPMSPRSQSSARVLESRRGRSVRKGISLAAVAAATAGAVGVGGLTAASAAVPADNAFTAPARDKRPAPAGHRMPKVATMTGSGGSVASVDPVASQVGIDVLASGGNAADAAVATAAALGVVKPYANGIGGGGFFVYYDAKTGKVSTLDGRETAPAGMGETAFLENGAPMDFERAVNSGLSVGIPGTPATWAKALDKWGTRSFSAMLAPAQRIAERGFVIDDSFTTATEENAERFAMFPETAKIFLPGGEPIKAGAVLRQPDLAKAYRELRHEGPAAMYRGDIGRAIVKVVNAPVTAKGVTVPAGSMTRADLRAYRVLEKAPVHSTYRGLDVYGMPVPSSGGIAVAQSLNLLEAYEARTGEALSKVSDAQYLHRFAEATATAFADRNRWVGEGANTPAGELISKGFATERACGFDPAKAQARPIAFGSPDGDYGDCTTPAPAKAGAVNDGQATTHLTVADKWGNVAAYTLTIEQFGGSGMVVPGYGFLLNNELTDFNMEPMTEGVPDPNLPAPGKRPRSSMSPTIVLKDGKPYLAVGAAGGATIITTSLQIITGYHDRGMPLVKAVAAPRISSRNTSATAEPGLIVSPLGQELAKLGQPMDPADTIGRATAIAFGDKGVQTPATETTRGGGGSAMVVKPAR